MARFSFAWLLFVLSFGAMAATSHSEEWPSRSIRLIVPFGAGGSGDTLARIVAQHLSEVLGKPVVVEDRPGANGIIGTQQFIGMAPDGYTIGETNLSSLTLATAINPAASYDPVKDFTHIAYIGGSPVVLAANPTTGVKTLKDFISYAKTPGQSFTFASSGIGSDGHLMGEAIAMSMDVPSQHVPYKATAEALTDVVGGHVNFSTSTLSSTAPFLHANSLNGIAVTTAERLPDYPDLPTFKELGYPELVDTTWFGLAGPPDLPAEFVNRLNREVVAAVSTTEVQERFRRDGFFAELFSPQQMKDFIAAESSKWNPVIEKVGLAKSSN